MKKIYSLFGGKIILAVFVVLFIVELFTRFYALETKSAFGWDQIDNAWAAKDIIADHKFPLVGMQAKGNAGFFIGPYYYYYASFFYLLTGLNPIASGIIAGVTSIISFLTVFFTLKDMLNKKIAIIALFIYTVSAYIIIEDRVQWPVNFIVPVSFLVFYSIYKIINKKEKYLLLLFFALGFSLHIHFTSIFYFIFVLLAAPFFPRNKKLLKYLVLGAAILSFFIAPLLINAFTTNSSAKLSSYMAIYYHGFHLRRVMQLAKDGFIEFQGVFGLPQLKYAGFILFPLFILIFLKNKLNFKRNIFVYLCIIWLLIPWLVFSTYRGEISNYYFTLTRPIVLIVVSYLMYRLAKINKLATLLIVAVLAFYLYYNANVFFKRQEVGLAVYRPIVLRMIEDDIVPNFSPGDPKPYLYYYYKYKENAKK